MNGRMSTGMSAGGRVPELHTVQYLFEDPTALPDIEGGPRPGFVRRELDWETRGAGADGAANQRHERGPQGNDLDRHASSLEKPVPRQPRSTRGLGTASSRDTESPLGEGANPVDDALLVVPEVVGLEFKYHDGHGWTGQWNSLTQKSLPLAIEVTLSLKVAEAARRFLAILEAEHIGRFVLAGRAGSRYTNSTGRSMAAQYNADATNT